MNRYHWNPVLTGSSSLASPAPGHHSIARAPNRRWNVSGAGHALGPILIEVLVWGSGLLGPVRRLASEQIRSARAAARQERAHGHAAVAAVFFEGLFCLPLAALTAAHLFLAASAIALRPVGLSVRFPDGNLAAPASVASAVCCDLLRNSCQRFFWAAAIRLRAVALIVRFRPAMGSRPTVKRVPVPKMCRTWAI